MCAGGLQVRKFEFRQTEILHVKISYEMLKLCALYSAEAKLHCFSRTPASMKYENGLQREARLWLIGLI